MKINNKFDIGQIVFLITDKNQNERIITGIEIRYSNQICYRIAFEESESFHCEIEISEEKDTLKTFS